jgi:hypothetical protein
LSEVLGREITYTAVPDDAARQAMLEMASPEVMVDILMGLNNIIRKGYTAAVTADVETVTGRPPRDFEAFARNNAAAWQ